MAAPEIAEPVAKLIETLQSGATRDKRTAAAALAAFGPDAAAAIPSLIYCLTDEDAAIRIYAAEALGKIGLAAAPELILALKNRNDEVRQAVVRALTALDPNIDDVLPTLTRCLGDIDTTVRMDASNALVKAGKLAVPHLTEGLKDEDPGFRKACCVTLGRIGPAAKPALNAIVQGIQDGKLGAEAGEAIQAIQGNFLAVLVRFARNALIRAHLTIVVLLLFAALIIAFLWIADRVLNVSLAVVAVVLSWGVIGTLVGAAIGYHTRWRRMGAIVGAVVMGLGSVVSGAMVGETFIRISERVIRGLWTAEPKSKAKDQLQPGEQDQDQDKPEADSPIPVPVSKP